MILKTPREFSLEFCIQFLQRSPNEVLHVVENGTVIKLLRFEKEVAIIELKEAEAGIQLKFLNGKPSVAMRKFVVAYVEEWFDLKTDLKPFYKLCRSEELLRGLDKKYAGYRIVGYPDLFESLIWAVLGQQINVQFAYTLKRRFVENFGEKVIHNDETFYLFPEPEIVSMLKAEQLLPLQFSKQKALYTIGIAQAFVSGELSKQQIGALGFDEARETLIRIKGVGNWTANYVLMKTFRHSNAFPLEDVALHNAIRIRLNLKSKPSLERVKRLFKRFKGWEAYATLYLWKSL